MSQNYMDKERDHLPDHGPQYAMFIALFDARIAGLVATKDDVKRAVAEEHGDKHVVITDEHLYVIASRLRQALQDSDSEYQIINRRGLGYEIYSTEEIE